jgi:hypothetical protein
MTLKTTINTPDMAERIQEAFDVSDFAFHDNAEVCYEHGQHYVNCSACGAMWSVVDAEPGIDGFDFEEMEGGDESCG